MTARRVLAAIIVVLGQTAFAQQSDAIIVTPLEELEARVDDGFGGGLALEDEDFQTFEQELRTARAETGVLRVLDKTTGRTQTLEIDAKGQVQSGRLTIQMAECRYPEENPASDAFVRLSVMETGVQDVLFDGWMIASSPALAALDHHRYDVWAIRCKTGEAEPTPGVAAGLKSPRPAARP